MVNSSHIIALGPSGAAGPIPDIGGTGPTGPIGVTGPTGERGITGTLGSSGIGFGYCGPTAPLVFQHYDDKDNAMYGMEEVADDDGLERELIASDEDMAHA